MRLLPISLLVFAALAAPARDLPAALSAKRTGEGDPNRWALSWNLGEAADQRHDLLVLAGIEEGAFEVIHRFPDAQGRGSGPVTLRPEHRWLSLQSAAELGGSRLGALDLRLAEIPLIDLAEIRDELGDRHPEVPVEVHQRDPLFPDCPVLSIGPVADEEVIVLDLPWTPAGPLALSYWVRVRGDKPAAVTCRPVSIGGDTPASDEPIVPLAPEHGWQFVHLSSAGAPSTTTHYRLVIEAAPGEQGPVMVEASDLRLEQKVGPPTPPHARLLGRIPGTPTSMALSEDGQRIVIGYEGSVAVFDPVEQRTIARHRVGSGSLSWVGAANGQLFAIDATPALWHVELGSGRATRLAALRESTGIGALSGDGGIVAVVQDSRLHLWSIDQGRAESLAVKGLPRIESLAFEDGTLRITTDTKTMIYDPTDGSLEVSKIHGQTGFARPVFNHNQRIWTDPKRRKFYTLQSATLEPYPPEAGRPGPAFPAGLRKMVIRPAEGEILLADCYGQIWQHPPLPVPAAAP